MGFEYLLKLNGVFVYRRLGTPSDTKCRFGRTSPTNKKYLFFVCSHVLNLCPRNERRYPRRVSAAARAKPTIVVGRFCGRGMGVLREGIRPFPEAALCFVSVGTEMKIKNLQERFLCVSTALTLCPSGMRTVEDACPYNIFASIIDTV